jgi:hypothetical protein
MKRSRQPPLVVHAGMLGARVGVDLPVAATMLAQLL